MSEVHLSSGVTGIDTATLDLHKPKIEDVTLQENRVDHEAETTVISRQELQDAVKSVDNVISDKVNRTLSFSVIDELNRSLVVVSEADTDKVIRQFPSEEFISVAKHIASKAAELDENMLVGILFDKKT
jgi:flagellar protein FlaG